jgi:hypothetical protein
MDELGPQTSLGYQPSWAYPGPLANIVLGISSPSRSQARDLAKS